MTLEKTITSDSFAGDFPPADYGACLDRVRQRTQFYHVRRGQKYAGLQESMRGDDYTDAYSCEGHVQWLAGYWRILTKDSTIR